MKRNIQRIGGALLLAAALTGCGGGGGGGGGGGFYPFPVGGNNPPPDQLDAYDQFVAYVQALVASVLDTEEPANVAAFDPPPTSETKDPVATQ
ncbi:MULTISPECIES: hypothetical protein [unclassified Variovorax]|jgi:hypothetical protein|uniref:hypothetical protein n=1 Tax=unclassified Variovorax TaxID=663243 RepID=UPI0008CFA1E3|nr:MULTISPECIES: hypothetical protein [unclassified Variovorax]SEK09587.1 hypothetical protein SAMN05518853_1098 [Variovorax sp. OK202]SFD63921.1 hypothetical protein SAMN05444746_1098 [Variovorax sp. OK212]